MLIAVQGACELEDIFSHEQWQVARAQHEQLLADVHLAAGAVLRLFSASGCAGDADAVAREVVRRDFGGVGGAEPAGPGAHDAEEARREGEAADRGQQRDNPAAAAAELLLLSLFAN